jgi:hypothetical protein
MAVIQFNAIVTTNDGQDFTINFDFARTKILVSPDAFETSPTDTSGIQEVQLKSDAAIKLLKFDGGVATQVSSTAQDFFNNDGKETTGNSAQGGKMGLISIP